MRRIATIFAACLLAASSGAAVAVASSGSDDTRTTTSTSTTSTSTTPKTTTSNRQGALRRARSLEGRIVALDAATKRFELRVRKQRRGIPRGTVLTIAATDATSYKRLPDGFASLVVGNAYKVKLRVREGTPVALRIEAKRQRGRGNDDGRADDRGSTGSERGDDARRGGDDGDRGRGHGGDDDGPDHD